MVGKIDWAKTRGIVFLDPFDMAIEHDALSSISSTEALDVWILFPLMATVRVMARDGVPDSWKNKIDKMYGSREWEEFIYSTSSQLTLFDNDAKSRLYRREGFDDILAYTTKWLKELFADASDSPYLLRNRKGMPLFALYSAISSHNPSAINLWKKISSHLLSA